MREFMCEKMIFFFTFHACAFGAPWKKPTSILTSLQELAVLQLLCTCRCADQILAGKAPDGRNWTAVASPYWPELTVSWAKSCISIQPGPSDPVPSSSHLSGFGFHASDISLDTLLSEMSFEPSGRCIVFVFAARVAAGVQSAGRSLPTILPEFLGPDAHLACAKQIQHPSARVFLLQPDIAHALQLHRIHGSDFVQYSERVCALYEKLASVLEARNLMLVSKAHEWLRPILAKRQLAFMLEFNWRGRYYRGELLFMVG